MKIDWAICSQQGERPENQDRYAAHVTEDRAIFIICDGVAGTDGGAVAAQLVCDTLLKQLSQALHLTPALTGEVFKQCQQKLQQAQRSNPKFSQMSTTVAALFIDRLNAQVWWAHAGDSRVYSFCHGELNQVTRDHSLAQQLHDAGYENSGINSNLLYNALGIAQPRGVSQSLPLPLEDGDAFIVCSDGFWRHLPGETMAQALRMVTRCDEWLTLMAHRLDTVTKSDNLSAMGIWVGEPEETTLIYSQADAEQLLPRRT
ncbi:PP2C family protein-serine/threonine phosphatase [Pantoea sp. A4]|uniref:PP2C family protein-serine/threonine phosphatase n=1 Tax=Pantoea sp. A4 TaxID=1225184 RepID=UPI0003741187|nr:PP2C family serine/threonine-protein phosphatase [Pantoea sp. A4]